SAGLRLKGEINSRTRLEANINHFAILDDETRTSARNPRDPDYSPEGSVNDFDNTGWQTADLKLSIDDVGIAGLNVVSGLRYEAYELNARSFHSTDYVAGSRGEKPATGVEKPIWRLFFANLNGVLILKGN